MVTKKDLVVAVLITFCLTASLFLVKLVRSQSTFSYNPFADLRGTDPSDPFIPDGKIDMRDIGYIAKLFGSSGTPVNTTALLYNVSDTFTSLLAKIDSLNFSLSELQSQVNSLNGSILQYQSSIASLNSTLTSRIDSLESELASLNTTIATKLGPPDYDSLWTPINQGQSLIFTHNLGATDVLVYLVGDYPSAVPYIHQHDYGGEVNGLNSFGAYWSELTTTTIKVTRNGNDANWPYVRVMIWKLNINYGDGGP